MSSGMAVGFKAHLGDGGMGRAGSRHGAIAGRAMGARQFLRRGAAAVNSPAL